jgi:hypothetical protein
MWEPQPLTTLWAFTACYRDNATFFITVIIIIIFITRIYEYVCMNIILSRRKVYLFYVSHLFMITSIFNGINISQYGGTRD